MEYRTPELGELARLAELLDARMVVVTGQAESGLNTSVSGGIPIPQGTTTATAAPGAAGPGGQMSILSAVILTIGSAVAGLVVLRLVFGKGDKLPPARIDAVEAFKIYWSWLVIDGTLKLVAYKFHGHKLAQAYLLIA
jgi:hypothetical protein